MMVGFELGLLQTQAFTAQMLPPTHPRALGMQQVNGTHVIFSHRKGIISGC